MSPPIAPLPQHVQLVDWLRREEREVWDWMDGARQKEDPAEHLQLSLLKNTYRLDADAHGDLAREVDAAKAALGLDVPVQLYQAQGSTEANAAVYPLKDAVHLVFSGPLLTLLSPDEIRGVVGHELAHYQLWQYDGGAYFLADRILDMAAAHPGAQASHVQTARLWNLATELYADRGSFLAAGAIEPAVAGLVKTATGLSQVSARSYLAQAAEIFAKSKPKTEQLSHPETFMRAWALQLWAEQAADPESQICAMLEPEETLDTLTVPAQLRLTLLTRRFLAQLLRPAWFHSEAVLAHARHFFPDFQPATEDDQDLVDDLRTLPPNLREYFCALLVDFGAVDRDLEDAPRIAALEWARRMECLGTLEKMLMKELKVKAKDLRRLKSRDMQPHE